MKGKGKDAITMAAEDLIDGTRLPIPQEDVAVVGTRRDARAAWVVGDAPELGVPGEFHGFGGAELAAASLLQVPDEERPVGRGRGERTIFRMEGDPECAFG